MIPVRYRNISYSIDIQRRVYWDFNHTVMGSKKILLGFKRWWQQWFRFHFFLDQKLKILQVLSDYYWEINLIGIMIHEKVKNSVLEALKIFEFRLQYVHTVDITWINTPKSIKFSSFSFYCTLKLTVWRIITWKINF